MKFHERESNIDLHLYTKVSKQIFPIYDEAAALEPISNTDIPHIGRVQQRGAFIEKAAIRNNHDIYLEALAAVIINHVAAKKSYYFKADAIKLRGISYSISLLPEVPYKLQGDRILYTQLPGQNAHKESWEKMIDWEEIGNRPDQKMVIEDLDTHARLLRKVDTFYKKFLRDIKKSGVELEDHWLGYKQVVLKVDTGLRHVFIGIVDFEQVTPETATKLTECTENYSTFSESLNAFLKKRHKTKPSNP